MPNNASGDLFRTEALTASAKPERIFTVSEITQDIKVILENTFGQVWVEGEISNFRPSQAGHFYFSLKDQARTSPTITAARISAMTDRASPPARYMKSGPACAGTFPIMTTWSTWTAAAP